MQPAQAPEAKASEIRAAVAVRRDARATQQQTAADCAARLQAPPASRLKTLLTGKGDDRAGLIEKHAGALARIADLDREIGELTAALLPHEGIEANYAYDQTIRPALRKDLRDLAAHLNAARDLFVVHEDVYRQADAARMASLGRSITSERLTGVDAVQIDPREIDLINRWRSVLVGPQSRLALWFADAKAHGIELEGKGGRR